MLGQIVEDVTGIPLSRYLREHLFGPLGMEHSDLLRSERVQPRLATGYQLGSRGLKAVADREVVPVGAGAVYSTTSDMARYAAALLGGGAGEHGRVVKPETLATMFRPHYQPIPGYRAWAWGFSAATPASRREAPGIRGPEPGVAHAQRLKDPGRQHLAERLPGRPRRQHAQHLGAGVVHPPFAGLGEQRQAALGRDPGVRVRRHGRIGRADRRQPQLTSGRDDRPRPGRGEHLAHQWSAGDVCR